MRIALLGGSFDPIHEGHLRIAKTALAKLPIDEVWFLPCKDAPLKKGQQVAFHHRCAMVKLAIAPYRRMKLCTLEGELDGVSYTIRTIKELKKRFPHDTFSFLIGDDQAAQFDKWKDSAQLKQEACFYVFSRHEDGQLPTGMKRVPMQLISVSSTEIRNGEKKWALPKTVRRYIGSNGLYVINWVKASMSEKRFQHSVSVAEVCVRLAHAHHLDEHVAWCMGIAHDICKQMPFEKAKIWMIHHMPSHLQENRAIWHGYIGADYTKRFLYMEDKRIISAIYHHVLGDGASPYAIILYVADKLDPARGYDSSEQLLLCEKSLSLGLARVKQEQQEYLRKKGVIS